MAHSPPHGPAAGTPCGEDGAASDDRGGDAAVFEAAGAAGAAELTIELTDLSEASEHSPPGTLWEMTFHFQAGGAAGRFIVEEPYLIPEAAWREMARARQSTSPTGFLCFRLGSGECCTAQHRPSGQCVFAASAASGGGGSAQLEVTLPASAGFAEVLTLALDAAVERRFSFAV